MESYKIPRHKVFISYYHAENQNYKNLLSNMTEWNYEEYKKQTIFDDCSVQIGDIDDERLTDEQIRRIIRDDYIDKSATVMIVLCGKNTWGRKHVDWEIHAAMWNGENRPKLGILVINLPEIECYSHIAAAGNDKEFVSENNSWRDIASRNQIERDFPYLPSRIVDNFESRINDNSIVNITVVSWSRIKDNPYILKNLIHSAYLKGKDATKHYNHSSRLRRKNEPIK